MVDQCEIWLENAENTKWCGQSLAQTLYGPTDIFLYGELGAGKTTFLDGFSNALGIDKALQSPTYALENRYPIAKYGELIHIDLYRLSPTEAAELVQQTDDHTGIRCIEWADRVNDVPEDGIHLHLEDHRSGRSLTARFADARLPSAEQIAAWRTEVALPEHIARHCDAIADFCWQCADRLHREATLLRPQALYQAARLHDLLRFIDFQPGAAHDPAHDPVKEPPVWQQYRNTYAGQRHEAAISSFLQSNGYPVLADIVLPHGVRLPPEHRATIEQKLLYYADKRFIVDKKVSLQERFDDFMHRYGGGQWSKDGREWFTQAQAVEQELFGNSPP